MSEVIPSLSLKRLAQNESQVSILDLPRSYEMIDPWVSRPHRLQFNQLLLILQGGGSHRIDSQTYQYKPGSLVFTAQGQVQQIQITDQIEGHLILFTNQYLYRHCADLQWFFDLHLFQESVKTPTTLEMPTEEVTQWGSLVEQLRYEQVYNPDLEHDAIQHHLLKILLLKAERLKRIQADAINADSSQTPLLTRFHQLLEEHYASNRRVYDYAHMLCVTPRRLNSLSQQCLGKTAKHAIDERVVLEIQRMLRYSDATAHEIAFSLGFSEVGNMAKFFKRYTGQTPAQFKASS